MTQMRADQTLGQAVQGAFYGDLGFMLVLDGGAN